MITHLEPDILECEATALQLLLEHLGCLVSWYVPSLQMTVGKQQAQLLLELLECLVSWYVPSLQMTVGMQQAQIAAS